MYPELTFHKTRLAPTPSGFLHLGNVLSFAVTAALAAKTNAKIFLRIDDVDRERTNKRYIQDIFDTLNFLEIPWHEGPRNMHEFEHEYSQMCRMDLYTKVLQELKESGAVFACSCSRSDVLRLSADSTYQGTCRDKKIPYDTENVGCRLLTSATKELEIKTIQGTTIKTTLPQNMQDFVVRKRDGFPAYQLTSLIDDIHFGIDLIVRGEDLWPSTLAQQYLALQLHQPAFAGAAFYHHPLLLAADGSKLSKSAGATSVQHFRELYKKPADVYAYTASMLGLEGNPKTWMELAQLFNLNIDKIL